ncbi:phosphoribulokinase / Uridine kinase family protein [Bacillus clarus]|nr:phosphoribulokinase / Uridine kinase family protein [Bacillus clarus]
MRELIDLTIYIDTPLDIAMARRIMRDFAGNRASEIHDDLKHYVTFARKAYLETTKNVKQNSDIVVNGSLSVGVIVDQLVEELKRREVILKGYL